MSGTVRYEDYLHERLRNPEFAVLYLNASLDSDDDGDFLFALGEVSRANGGVRPLAGKAGLNREHLFRMLSKTGNPGLHSLRQILDALGFRLELKRAA
ncbi:putative addiction module antidote protein [bacterium]|nr:MAG: putative addiction module antidote protein [bacterium]